MTYLKTEHLLDIEDALRDYPHLKLCIGPEITVQGTWEVKNSDNVIDTYQIKIEISPGYPDIVPLVFETGGRIPKHQDRHLIPPTWHACLFVRDARWEAWPLGSSFKDFLSIPVHNYFLAQAIFEEYGEFKNGEYSHGDKGIKEYYAEKFKLSNPLSIANLLYTISLSNSPNECPCLSGKKYNKCHKNILEKLKQNIDQNLLAGAFDLFWKECKTNLANNEFRKSNKIANAFQSPPSNFLK